MDLFALLAIVTGVVLVAAVVGFVIWYIRN
jgi:hypothetical protein